MAAAVQPSPEAVAGQGRDVHAVPARPQQHARHDVRGVLAALKGGVPYGRGVLLCHAALLLESIQRLRDDKSNRLFWVISQSASVQCEDALRVPHGRRTGRGVSCSTASLSRTLSSPKASRRITSSDLCSSSCSRRATRARAVFKCLRQGGERHAFNWKECVLSAGC